MPAPVVIELFAPQPQPQEVQVLLAACSRAATPRECVTSDAKGAEAPLGVAIVRREGNRARIELGLRGGVNAQWSTRELDFQPGDDELERYRAIGFAVGTLIARETEPPPAATPETTEKAAPPASTMPAPSPPAEVAPRPVVSANKLPEVADAGPVERSRRGRAARGVWLDAAGGVGLGLIPGPVRTGAQLRAGAELVPRGFFGVVEGGYAEGSVNSTLRVRWINLALGLGQPLAPNLKTLGVDVRLMFAVERVAFLGELGDQSATSWRWKPGAVVAIDGHWVIVPPLSLLVSAATFVDPGHTVVLVGGDKIGESPTLGLSGFIGLRFRLR